MPRLSATTGAPVRRPKHDWEGFLDRPFTDPSLWKIAWEGDRVVGQVRSFINTEENQEYDRLRGYTENISTIKEWRGKGVAQGADLSKPSDPSRPGMHEAALGVHAENPTGAFHLYSSLGYEVVATWVCLRATARLVEVGPGQKRLRTSFVAVHVGLIDSDPAVKDQQQVGGWWPTVRRRPAHDLSLSTACDPRPP